MSQQEWDGIINIQRADKFHPPSHKVYSMTKYPRGPALIVCVRNFIEGCQKERFGSEQDVAAMETLLQQLYFDVQPTLLNPTKTEMWKELCAFAHMCHMRGRQQHDECLALVLMSHGNERDEIYGSDGKTILIKCITDLFTASRCPGFAGKPKLFIILACRGRNMDSGHDESDADALMPVLQQEQSFPQDLLDHLPVIDPTEVVESDGGGKVGNRSDIYIAYSTTEDDVSWRNSIRGSWFIQDLVRAFDEEAHEVEIDSIFRRVNQLVQERGDRSKVQTPSIKHQLRKKLYFNTKHPISRSADEYTVRGEEMVAGGGDVAWPWGVTVSRTGQTLFTDWGNHTLNIVSPQGVKRRIGGRGSGQLAFICPLDVTTNYKEEIMIADWGNSRVKVLSKEGEYVRDIKVDGEPQGLCVDNENNLYVATYNPPQVIKYNEDEREIKRMRRDEFKSIHHLVHHRGRLYITDYQAHIIHVVTRDLEYVTKIGEGHLEKPVGITIDKHNTLLVTGFGGVVALTLEGEFVAKIAEGRIKSARGITTDQDGDKIIICHSGNKRVVRLQM